MCSSAWRMFGPCHLFVLMQENAKMARLCGFLTAMGRAQKQCAPSVRRLIGWSDAAQILKRVNVSIGSAKMKNENKLRLF
jgi:hypothetical protein